MTSPQTGLDPARGDDRRAMLSALELVAGGDVEGIEVGRAEVGQCVSLEPCPQELHRIEIGRVRRQERHLDLAVGGVEILAHEPAAVRLEPVPDDQQRLLQVRSERLEELDVLLFLIEPSYILNRQFVRLSPAITEMCVQLK